MVKNAILWGYELVPEAYRQSFHNLRKVTRQTYVDFAREIGIIFDRWCSACKAFKCLKTVDQSVLLFI